MNNQAGNVLVLLKCLVALVLVTGVSTTSVATIYDVHRVVGPGTITGTIETNGTTGVLASADIIDWNLTVDADGIQATSGLLLGPLSGGNSSITILEGSVLTATPTALFFDFSLSGFAILQIATPASDASWQLLAAIFSNELIRESPVPPHANQSSFNHPPFNQQIATAVVVNAVDIDIKPGSDPNSINPSSKGKIPVAILTTASFDALEVFYALEVDPLSVEFGPNGATESHGQGHVEDVDDDGDMDLVLHFNTQETGVGCGDIEATLTAETFGGQSITGTDSIKTVGCPRVPVPECDIQLNQAVYIAGDTVTADVFRFANLTGAPVATEINIWLSIPGLPPISIGNVGADGSVEFPAGTDVDIGPIPLIPVTAALPRGNYEFTCHLLNPATGVLLAEDRNFFEILTTYVIGDTGPAGGIVFHVTDRGLHGLEAAPMDQGKAPWGCFYNYSDIDGANGTAVGTGAQNTADILAGCPEIPIAAYLVDAYTLNGFTDWFLPSRDELNELYLQRDVVGGFARGSYWSSSEISFPSAWGQSFFNGSQGNIGKTAPLGVRAVRAF